VGAGSRIRPVKQHFHVSATQALKQFPVARAREPKPSSNTRVTTPRRAARMRAAATSRPVVSAMKM